MNEYAHLVWAPAVVTVAYLGRNVAVTWLNGRERASEALEQRNERETGAVAKLREDLGALKSRVETFIANNARAR